MVIDGIRLYPVKGWEEDYLISKCGKIWSVATKSWRSVRGHSYQRYAQISLYRDNTRVTRPIHRLMAETFLSPEEGLVVDHINRDPFDNRLENLRMITPPQNSWNSKRSSTNTSGFKGVSASGSRWIARIYSKGRSFFLGSFSCRRHAAEAYDKAAIALRGEFASLNFPSLRADLNRRPGHYE